MDIRLEASQYYDLQPFPDDVAFYENLISPNTVQMLELGCGTGRVLSRLAKRCRYIHGIDLSEAMLSICRQKLQEAGVPKEKAYVEVGDITDFCLGRTFDFIIAPFRVIQNLETDDQVNGLFSCIDKHLTPNGNCILNAFHPWPLEKLRRSLTTRAEEFNWEVTSGEVRLACHHRIHHIDFARQVLYPELIYRSYKDSALENETTFNIIMRFYYPQQFEDLIVTRGFKILNRWGGYADEPYGCGSELVIEFGLR